MRDLLFIVSVIFMSVSAGLFWTIVAATVWDATEDRRKASWRKVVALIRLIGLWRDMEKLIVLEGDIGNLQEQIEKDFPGELPECPYHTYKEQDVIDTAGLLLGRYHIYARAGEKVSCCPKPSDQPTFAPFRQPSGTTCQVEGVKIAKV